MSRFVFLLLLIIQIISSTAMAALPRRLVLLIDGVSYRDMKAVQEGITCTNANGRQSHIQCFREGYFPVSRNVSTFPSTSDVAWTEILGDRPLPGYQRTYFSDAADSEIFQNGVSTTMEYEKQMNWQMEGGFRRAMGYIHTLQTFRYELNELGKNFLNATNGGDNYYAMIRSTDDAQHMSGDIIEMLGALDIKIQELRARCKTVEGRDLEILVLSDHGNNHAGGGKRVDVRNFLEKNGYRPAEFIQNPKDVVLPTVGIESWVEIHNSPAETQRLVPLLSQLEGVDLLTARVPGQPNKFIVMNSKGGRALIEWNSANNSFRYTAEIGDPINYLPIVAALSAKNEIDADGFATADDWMAETLAHRYPLALERIVRAHTRITLNPATILISLKNGYVHAGWLVKKASGLVTSGGTHGALDDINSDGIVLSSFAPTKDTSTSRVAALFGGFKGLRNYRAQENGAEWFSRKAQAMTAIKRTPLDNEKRCVLPDDGLFLRIWSPDFARLESETPVEATIEKIQNYTPAQAHLGNPKPTDVRHLTLNQPVSFPDNSSYERAYPFSAGLNLAPQKIYRISGMIRNGDKTVRLFTFNFHTDSYGLPVSY